MADAVPTSSPASGPPPFPRHRVDDARAVATVAGWPAACPDPACRHGACAGELRKLGAGPRSFPTCLHVLARWWLDRDGLTIREADAALGFLFVGEGWTVRPVPAGEETGWPFPGEDDPEALLPPHHLLLGLLGRHVLPGEEDDPLYLAWVGTGPLAAADDAARKPPARSMKLATTSTPTPARTLAKT